MNEILNEIIEYEPLKLIFKEYYDYLSALDELLFTSVLSQSINKDKKMQFLYKYLKNSLRINKKLFNIIVMS